MRLASLTAAVVLGSLLVNVAAKEKSRKKNTKPATAKKKGSSTPDVNDATLELMNSMGLQGMGKSMHKMMDKNGDGVVTLEEMQNAATSDSERERSGDMFKMMDKNGDGEVTAAEADGAFNNFGDIVKKMEEKITPEEKKKMQESFPIGQNQFKMEKNAQLERLQERLERMGKLAAEGDVEGLKALREEMNQKQVDNDADRFQEMQDLRRQMDKVSDENKMTDLEKEMMTQLKTNVDKMGDDLSEGMKKHRKDVSERFDEAVKEAKEDSEEEDSKEKEEL